MHRISWFILTLWAVFPWVAQGQILVKGELINSADGGSISYANIGIFNKNIGTISNQDGTFEIQLDSTHLAEQILFSALGYVKKSLPVAELLVKDFNQIYLEETSIQLSGITVKSDIKKIRGRRFTEFGNEVHTAGTIRLDTARAGGSVALLIRNEKVPANIKKARLYILQNSMEAFKVRVRLYKLDPDTGLPGADLLEESVVINSSMRKGWLEVDLSTHNIWVKDPEFYLAFEWIMDKDDRRWLARELLCFLQDNPENLVQQSYEINGKTVTDTKIVGFRGGTWFGTTYLPRTVNRHTCYYRLNSLGEWKRSPAILSAQVSALVEK